MRYDYEKRRAEYLAKLRDPRWQKLRLEVLQRDGWKCLDCKSAEKTLHVHHTYYRDDAEPWDYAAESLLTLCGECHEAETQALREHERYLVRAIKQFGLRADDIELLAGGFAARPGWAALNTIEKYGLLLALHDIVRHDQLRTLVVSLCDVFWKVPHSRIKAALRALTEEG